MGAGLIMPTLMTMTVNVVVPSRRGAANATSLTAFDMGIGIGAIMLGVLSKTTGYELMYIISAAVLVLPLMWYIVRERTQYAKMTEDMKNM